MLLFFPFLVTLLYKPDAVQDTMSQISHTSSGFSMCFLFTLKVSIYFFVLGQRISVFRLPETGYKTCNNFLVNVYLHSYKVHLKDIFLSWTWNFL